MEKIRETMEVLTVGGDGVVHFYSIENSGELIKIGGLEYLPPIPLNVQLHQTKSKGYIFILILY